MELCGEMLLAHLPPDLTAETVCPTYRQLSAGGPTLTRAYNRYIRYPRFVSRAGGRFDLFHIVDHSYAHLVRSVPAGRAGVFCHDLDLFRCLIDPAADPRLWWFRRLARRVLTGLQAAAVVFHGSAAVGDELRRAGLVDSARLVLAPYGVAPEFTRGPADSPEWVRKLGDRPWVLHVGSCLPRKRVDVALDVLAMVPDLHLVKVGGDWSADHRRQIERHRLAGRIVHVHGLTRSELAAAYRHAGAVLMPSAAEGFGLPVVEALACGAPVIASDLPALREAGGPAAVYVPETCQGGRRPSSGYWPVKHHRGPTGWPGPGGSPGRPTPRRSPPRIAGWRPDPAYNGRPTRSAEGFSACVGSPG
jgi:glycosyltransferase involved in cell wall biosynthesis